MSVLENLIAGFISGLVVTLLVVVFRALWRDILVPWFENRVYKDIRIEGAWYSIYPGVVGERPEVINLQRHGHSIKGSIICIGGADTGEQYKIHGSFRNLILTVTYESDSDSKIDRGTITLKCVKNGKRLVGKIASYHDPGDSIESTTVIWFHSKEEQEKALFNTSQQQVRINELRREERKSRIKQRKLAKEVVKSETPHAPEETEQNSSAQPAENATNRAS